MVHRALSPGELAGSHSGLATWRGILAVSRPSAMSECATSGEDPAQGALASGATVQWTSGGCPCLACKTMVGGHMQRLHRMQDHGRPADQPLHRLQDHGRPAHAALASLARASWRGSGLFRRLREVLGPEHDLPSWVGDPSIEDFLAAHVNDAQVLPAFPPMQSQSGSGLQWVKAQRDRNRTWWGRGLEHCAQGQSSLDLGRGR
jgi:hypothetical protein